MLNIQDIKRWNPQRYPLSLIDQILELVPEKSVIAIKVVTATEACFAHVSDDAPLVAMAYPNSLLIESFCQASGPLCAQSGFDFKKKTMLFVSMGNVEFIDAAYPGDVITHYCRIEKIVSDAVIVSGESLVGDRLIARFGQIVVAARDATR